MKKLSVVLATFNEEENIGKCLSSIKDLADEVVIVDGSSTDKTVEIAKSMGAKVTVTTNPQIFHINKQKAIDKATSEWIFQLDADEIPSEGLKNEIKKLISQKQNKNGFWIPRENFFLGRFLMKGGQYPDYTIRLYRNGKGKLPQKDVHEQAEVEGDVGYLTHALLHYPYKNFPAYLHKWNRYNNIISVQIGDEMAKKNLVLKLYYGLSYLLIKPIYWFLLTYIRHRGFMDSWQGFVFSLFSALRFPVSYVKYLRRNS